MVPESVPAYRRLLLGGFVASVAALTELAALWPGDVVVVDDVLAPPRLRAIIDELDFANWWPTENGWRQASGAFKRGVSLGRRSDAVHRAHLHWWQKIFAVTALASVGALVVAIKMLAH
jgi:hypothetical protein